MLRMNDGFVDPELVLETLAERRSARGPIINQMVELLRTYNGEVAVPLPELNANEQSLVANLVMQAIDAMGQRISSLLPTPMFPPLKNNKTAQKDARDRQSVVMSWWDKNSQRSKLSRRGRHYVGHGSTATVIRPNAEWGAPMWHLRRPYEAFPADTINDDQVDPSDVIFCYQRKMSWLKAHYPVVAMEFEGTSQNGQYRTNSDVEIIEYVDCHGSLTIARNAPEVGYGGYTTRKVRVLENPRYDYGGIIPATVLGRVTLGGKIMGQFDQMVPMYRMQAKLSALELAAIQKGIFPKVWFVSSNSAEPTIIRYPDPFKDQPGLVQDADMKVENVNPTYLASQMRSDLEYAQRMTGRIPSEQGGVGATNVRTGKRGDAILSQTVDFPVQEAQDDLCRVLEHENKAAIAVQRYHFGRKSYSFYVGGDKMKGAGEYIAKDLFTTDDHKVKYPYSGADVNTLSINIMQLAGSELMSKQTSREMHPLIEDAEKEKDRIVVESLTAAVLGGLQARAASADPTQAVPIGDLVALIKLVESDKMELPEAWEKVQKDAQERQAQQAPAGDPSTMPGAEIPGAGAEVPAAVPPPTASLSNLAAGFNRLRRPAQPQQEVMA